MTNPMIRIHNSETDEIIDRKMTDDELETLQKTTAIYLAEKNKVEAQATAKAALLDRLGINADEAKLLLS